jgi:hypothetical protein
MRRVLLAAALAAAALAAPVSAACPTDAELCVNNDAANVWVRDGQVWRGGDTLFDDVACLRERVAYLLDESTTDDWYGCREGEHRVV